MSLHARVDIPGTDELPATLSRPVYRVVQEGLTNARKHAPGAPVEVTITCDSQAALMAEVVSGQPFNTAQPGGADPAGAGAGLIGLAERLALAGGQLEHGTDAAGNFVLRARIPRRA